MFKSIDKQYIYIIYRIKCIVSSKLCAVAACAVSCEVQCALRPTDIRDWRREAGEGGLLPARARVGSLCRVLRGHSMHCWSLGAWHLCQQPEPRLEQASPQHPGLREAARSGCGALEHSAWDS